MRYLYQLFDILSGSVFIKNEIIYIMKNNNQKNPLDAASTTASELNEMNTMADSKPRPDEEIAERDVLTDFTYPVNFMREEGLVEEQDIVIKFTWDPQNGIAEHLAGCKMIETVTHPNSAPFCAAHSPFQNWNWGITQKTAHTATLLRTYSRHSYGSFFPANDPKNPYTALEVVSTMQFSWRQGFWSPSMEDVPIGDKYTIERKATMFGGTWMYECSQGDIMLMIPISNLVGEKYEQIRDIDSILKAIEPIKVGSTRAVLEKEFVLCGQQSLTTQRYQMRDCPTVRMDVTFDFIDLKHPFDSHDRITSFSKYCIDSPRTGV